MFIAGQSLDTEPLLNVFWCWVTRNLAVRCRTITEQKKSFHAITTMAPMKHN